MAGATNNYITGAVSGDMCIGNQNDGKILFGFGAGAATAKVTITSTGAATFSSKVTTTGPANDWGLVVNGSGTVGQSYGANIRGGSNSSDVAFLVSNYVGGDILRILGNGNVGIGTSSPTHNLEIANASGSVYQKLNADFGIAYIGMETFDDSFRFVTAQSTPIQFYTNNTERMRITSGGMVGIGTTGASNTRLTVAGVDASTSNYSIVVNNNTTSLFYVRNDGLSTFVNLAGSGSRAVLADASGNLSAPISDISVKENIKPIGYGLNEILKMNPVWFDFIDEYKNYGEGRQNGNIAQEMAEIIPEAVFVTPSTSKMGINYDQMHAVYIKAIQQLEARIKQLENK
jgi:hypothetical protein